MDALELLHAKVAIYETRFKEVERVLAYTISRLQASELQIVHVDLRKDVVPPEIDFIVDKRNIEKKDGFVLFYETVYDHALRQLEELHAKMVSTDA